MALEIIDQLAPAELASLSALKRRLRITGAEDDDLLRDLIREASAEVVSYCARPFARARVRESGLRLDGIAVAVALTPVLEVHEVSRGGEPILDIEVEDADAGFISAAGGILAQGESLWWNDSFRGGAFDTYTVEYTGGYLTPQEPDPDGTVPPRTLPFDIEAAVIAMVGYAYSPAAGDRTIKSVKVEDITYQYETAGGGAGSSGMDSALSVTDRLDRWRRVF